MAFDGIVTKAVASELQNLSGAKIDKIYQPDKNTILLGLYLNGKKYLLNVCISSQNYRINLTTHSKPNPQNAPSFCMLLRKYISGMYIKNIITNNLERIIIIELESFDDIDDLIERKIIIELMGKHCNIILVDEQNIIIDSLRHITSDTNNRNVIPHCKYICPTSNKFNFLECTDFNIFYNKILQSNQEISEIFNGISHSFIKYSIEFLDISLNDKSSYEKLYDYIMNIINSIDKNNLSFKTIENPKKDYILVENNNINSPFHLNFFIDDFYYEKENNENFKNYRDSILKNIFDILKKYQKRLYNIDEKLEMCKNMDDYKLYGELITANLYQIKNENMKSIELTNYYNNEKITIPLDDRYTPSVNAIKFFKKYHKLKNALEIVTKQKNETLQELNYIESIIYELEDSKSIEEVAEIFEEISENIIFKEKVKNKKEKIKKTSLTKNKTVSFNPLKYKIGNYTLLIGRNNKENDYLTLKYAKKTDIWFHAKDIHGSHAVLQLSNNQLPDDKTLIKCAQIVAFHSKAKFSSNVPVDICEVRYVRKPNGAKPGMVIYTNNKTLYVNPEQI